MAGIWDVNIIFETPQLDKTHNKRNYIIVMCIGSKGHLLIESVSLTVFLCDFVGKIIEQRGNDGARG